MNGRKRARALLAPSALLLLGLASCDDAKKFIDPTGKAYGTPADTSKRDAAKPTPSTPAAAPEAAPATVAAARPAAPTQRDVPPLASESALRQAGSMLFADGSRWIAFHGGRAIARGRNLTLWGPSEVPWGMAIADLNQDGADDAVFAVRWTSASDTSWSLAVLVDHDGKLQCTQAIPLPGIAPVTGLDATQGGVLVATATGDTRLFGWLGGQLVGN